MNAGSSGIEFHQAHFPGQAPIEAYGNGGFRFAQMSHRGSLMCLPSGIYAWDCDSVDSFTVKSFARMLDEAGTIEIVLIGSGENLVPINPALRKRFRDAKISADSMATGAAVRTYNVLVSEGRAVAAAFLAV